ncbi:hypothetical protein BDN70DRAFT_881109 [Pholiota conissans]|uniref:C2H2-type domain-containing protein n=1 Tax=Pholiota conissans TaxID=109636 RepID=A0A9P5YZI3_9AGAR|nr:hypothetical protein BDN70DRAFT_881109 [Pholiota conissans]
MTYLPSLLPAKPAIQDTTTTAEQVNNPVGKATNPESTPLFICALDQCYRLLPSRKVLMTHRKKDHPGHADDESEIITWNASSQS